MGSPKSESKDVGPSQVVLVAWLSLRLKKNSIGCKNSLGLVHVVVL